MKSMNPRLMIAAASAASSILAFTAGAWWRGSLADASQSSSTRTRTVLSAAADASRNGPDGSGSNSPGSISTAPSLPGIKAVRDMTPEEIATRAEDIFALDDPVARMEAYTSFIRSLQTNEQLEAAMAAFGKDFSPRERGREMSMLMTVWAQKDPEAALAHSLKMGDWRGGWAASTAISTAAALLAASRHPVISVNGNACALSAPELVELARVSGAQLEVNIFHASPERELAIRDMLMEAGATDVLLPSRTHALSHIDSNRRWVHPDGIFAADTVFVPLEDGDRCAALVRNGKYVITVDLNPLSRTARTATVTIVDNLVRCLPEVTAAVAAAKMPSEAGFRAARTPDDVLRDWNNDEVLRKAEQTLRGWIR